MIDRPEAPGRAGPNVASEPVRQPARRLCGAAAAMALPVCALVALLAGGCNNGNVVEISDPQQFRREVLECDQPVLVDFYKGGCPICWPLDPVLEQLAREYQGRAKIAKFMIMTPWWTFPYWDFKQEHRIFFVPEVLLFHKGVEVKRWQMMYLIEPYREELDRLAVPAGSGSLPGVSVPLRPASPSPAIRPPLPAPAPAGRPADLVP